MILKRITLRPEYHCSPVWDAESGDNLRYEQLGLNASLIAELKAWAERFDATLNQEYPPESGFADENSFRTFVVEGERLRSVLQAAFGPNCVVRFEQPPR